ncbi:uncharacterized protein [Sylvia atricapilla]|uniref:uncharacterized protein isoform X2 n=1 Tax=Sylvia atricapilla TaxID=48155 RepID=UPI00339295D2
MSRKKRKSCKSRKSSDSREYAELSPICKCRQSVGSFENKAHETLSHFTEPLDVKGAEKDGKVHENKNQSSSDASEDRDLDNVSDSEKEGKKKKNCPPKMFSSQQDEILATVTFGESEGSPKGKITLWGKPDSSDSISLAPGKISAEVKCGSFNVKVEVKNISLLNSGTTVVDEKRKSSKNKKCHERQCHKRQCSECSKYQCPSIDHSAKHRGKYKGSSKHKIQTAINESASLEMNIETKDIQVEYTSRKKNLKVNLKAGEQAQSQPLNRKHEDTYWSETDYSVTEALCNTDCESSFSFHEKADYAFPDGYTLLPPPKEFADCDKMHLDTIAEVVSLYPVNSRKESGLSTALSIWGKENYLCKLNTDDCEDHTNEKEDFSKDKILFSKINSTNCLVGINTLHNPNNGKECVTKSSVLGQERNKCDKHRDTGPKTARRKSFPDTTLEVPSPVHPRRDSGFYSLPSLNVLLKETKVDVHSRNSHIPTKYKELCKCPDLTSSLIELCKYPDLTSSLRNLRSLKSSYQYAFTSFDRNIAIYPSEPEEYVCLDGTCLLNDYADCVGQDEETEETLMESLHSSGTIHEKKECGHEEPLGNLSMWEEDSESTETVDKEKSEYNSIEKHVEWQNKTHLVRASSLSTSPSGELINDKESTNYTSTESIPKQSSVLQLNVHPLYAESEVTNKRKESILTDLPVVSGEVEGGLVQGDTMLIPECFGSAVKKEPNLTCSIQEKSLLSSLVLDRKEHGMNKVLESPSEVQDISGDVLVESDCHSNSAQASVLSTSSVCTEKKENFTEHPNIKQRLDNLCSKQSTDDSLRRESGANQLLSLIKSNFEEIESNSEMKEDYYENADISSSVKHTSQKDLKSEMEKSRKLPLKKDTRASDSSQEDAIDQWARRRKQFKDSKKCSSTGGSSINSTITEGSITSEDARSVDLGLYSENEDRGFYTENFHSASWVFRGDDVSPDNSPRCLSKRPRPVAIRERTVKIAKGTGNYPWGFRIQFSKPILVTEVDTSPDILTMIVGSDISRYPNTPKPTCRGYLHKRTQSAILKGWRKRWFVLKHNGYLHYYKHKKDEGKCRPLEVTKLEGAEIGVDTSLGKPFVFKCIPQAGNRIFHFCATSNQEMKRWLEAMDKAVHPIHQNHVWVDVTLHNTTLPPLAIKNPECLGLLHQLDRSKDVWIQHYCILKDGCLYFYATLRSTPAQGGLYLQGYIVSEQSLGSKRSVIELKPPSEEFKTFYLCAENVNENKRWITALKASINKWLPLHQAIQDFMNRPLEETRM